MAASTSANPISDLMYDWITVLQAKAEGVNAYEKYLRDAEQSNAQECVALFSRLHEQDSRQLQEIRDHVAKMMSKQGA